MIFELVQDFAAMLEAMPEKHPRRRILKLLDEAIRRDVHFLNRHPTTLFQCMWNTCWWYDCPEAAEHYAEPEGGWPAKVPWFIDGEKLFQLMEVWQKQRNARAPSIWIRSLRPPTTPLDSPIFWELRDNTLHLLDSAPRTCISADGKFIVANIYNSVEPLSSLVVIDANMGRTLFACNLPEKLQCVAFSPTCPEFATACKGHLEVHIWDVGSGIVKKRILLDEPCDGLVYSPDGNSLAVASRTHLVDVFDKHTGRLSTHRTPPFDPEQQMTCVDLTWGLDGLIMASSTRGEVSWEKKDVVIWRPVSIEILGSISAFRHKTTPTMLAAQLAAAVLGGTLESKVFYPTAVGRLSPTGDEYCVPYQQDIRRWRANGRELKRLVLPDDALAGENSDLVDVTFSYDGSIIAAISAKRDVYIWNRTNSKFLRRVALGPGPALSTAAFAGKLDRLLIATTAGLSLLDLTKRSIKWTLPDELVSSAQTGDNPAVSNDGTLIAGVTSDFSFRLWDARSGHTIRAWNMGTGANRDPLICTRSDQTLRQAICKFSPDGHWVLAYEFETEQGWLAATKSREPAVRLPFTRRGLYISPQFEFSPGGKFLAFTDENDLVLWDIAAAKQVCRINCRRIRDFHFTPNETHLAVRSTGKKPMVYFDTSTLKPVSQATYVTVPQSDGARERISYRKSKHSNSSLYHARTSSRSETIFENVESNGAVAFYPQCFASLITGSDGTTWYGPDAYSRQLLMLQMETDSKDERSARTDDKRKVKRRHISPALLNRITLAVATILLVAQIYACEWLIHFDPSPHSVLFTTAIFSSHVLAMMLVTHLACYIVSKTLSDRPTKSLSIRAIEVILLECWLVPFISGFISAWHWFSGTIGFEALLPMTLAIMLPKPKLKLRNFT